MHVGWSLDNPVIGHKNTELKILLLRCTVGIRANSRGIKLQDSTLKQLMAGGLRFNCVPSKRQSAFNVPFQSPGNQDITNTTCINFIPQTRQSKGCSDVQYCMFRQSWKRKDLLMSFRTAHRLTASISHHSPTFKKLF